MQKWIVSDDSVEVIEFAGQFQNYPMIDLQKGHETEMAKKVKEYIEEKQHEKGIRKC